MNSASIHSNTKPIPASKSQNSRFRVDIPPHNHHTISPPLLIQTQQTHQFQSPQFQSFVTLLPYHIMVKSKEKISSQLNLKSHPNHISKNILSYFLKSQKPTPSSKKLNKSIELKMKNLASKLINQKDLNLIYADISSNTTGKQFQKSLSGNWFKDQISPDTEKLPKQKFSEGFGQNQTVKRPQYIKSVNKKDSTKPHTQIIALSKKFIQTKKKFVTQIDQLGDEGQNRMGFNLNKVINLDNESEDEYLCNNDIGIINESVKDSYNYQQEIQFLIKSSQLEEVYQQNKKTKLKTFKTEPQHQLFSHNLISDMMRRINNGHAQEKTTIPPQLNSNRHENSVSMSSYFQQDQQYKDKTEPNKENLFSPTLNQTAPQKNQLPNFKNQQKTYLKTEFHQYSSKTLKPYQTNSLTMCGQQKIFAYKYSNSNLRIHSKNYQRKTHTENSLDEKEFLNQSFQIKQKRAMTATDICPQRLQSKSLLINQCISTKPYTNAPNPTLEFPNHKFCDKTALNQNSKIWMKLKNGKVIKKSVKYIENHNYSSHFQRKGHIN